MQKNRNENQAKKSSLFQSFKSLFQGNAPDQKVVYVNNNPKASKAFDDLFDALFTESNVSSFKPVRHEN